MSNNLLHDSNLQKIKKTNLTSLIKECKEFYDAKNINPFQDETKDREQIVYEYFGNFLIEKFDLNHLIDGKEIFDPIELCYELMYHLVINDFETKDEFNNAMINDFCIEFVK